MTRRRGHVQYDEHGKSNISISVFEERTQHEINDSDIPKLINLEAHK
jgi:hypothetical protein